MKMRQKIETKYGAFYDELNADDIKFFEMTDEKLDERANRLMHKVSNGIVDEEVREADERHFRNIELLLGKKAANYARRLDKKYFG